MLREMGIAPALHYLDDFLIILTLGINQLLYNSASNDLCNKLGISVSISQRTKHISSTIS